MSAFENAQKFFEACETAKGWAGCSPYVADNASFTAQSEPIADMKTVQEYCDWMAGFATVTAPGSSYDLHASSFDEANRKATFFATYHATHTGDGGPVPPTNKETHSHYVYVIEMNDDDKVSDMVKIWNAPWAMRELGWM
ncbi:MAG: nuclear transport factor 2 family protein [Gammaproteobacteria bacterium]|nr:nuclear transport factor 2 family protein [Gammaproteobacteria bacterium]